MDIWKFVVVLRWKINHQNLKTMESSSIIDLGILFVATLAFVLSIIELRSYKQKENNKLLSQLNKRYLANDNMQTVVKYLREIKPSDEKPSPYQTELFLRFFEELGVYLRHNNQLLLDFYIFFNYYFKQLYESQKGKELLKEINHEDEKLDYLIDYKKCMKKAEKLYNKKHKKQ